MEECDWEDFTAYARYGDHDIEVGSLSMPSKDGDVILPEYLEIDGVEYFPKP